MINFGRLQGIYALLMVCPLRRYLVQQFGEVMIAPFGDR